MNDFLATTPFDIYELYLFHLVSKHGSFTKAAEAAGLTQSAVTRQLQGMENSLGLQLLERTTRSVRRTPAGEFLFRESIQLLGNVEQALKQLREEFGSVRKEVRVGVSRSVGLAHLPGFFHANQKRMPEVATRVSYQSSSEILLHLEAHELDLGVLCPSARLPRTLRVTHRFKDAFTLIGPAELAACFEEQPKRTRIDWLRKQNWLLLEESSNTGRQLRTWMSKRGLSVNPAMELDSFDLIINLVALGMGVSFVPIRAMALYNRKRRLARLRFPERFIRDLVVVVRKHRKMPEHLKSFVDNVLF